MRWVIVAIVVSTLGASAVAFAAGLEVSSARLTVFSNTLSSPSIGAGLSTSSITVGETAYGTSSLTGATANAGGAVTYTVYSDDACSVLAVEAGSTTVSGAVAPPSDLVTLTAAGAYYWRAGYSGDGNNQPASSACAGPLTVNKATPLLTTAASGPVTVGAAITDTAALSGGYGVLTGSISFNVFAPGDGNCVIPLAPPPAAAGVNGAGNYVSGEFVTAASGDYRWVASYSGDANNNPVAGLCDDAGESSLVNPPPP